MRVHDALCRCRACQPPLLPLNAEEPTEMTFRQYVGLYAGLALGFCAVLYFATV